MIPVPGAAVLDSLADCFRNFSRFSKTHSDVTCAVTHDHQRRKAGNTTALDRLGHTVERDERFLEIMLSGIKFVSHFLPPKYSINVSLLNSV